MVLVLGHGLRDGGVARPFGIEDKVDEVTVGLLGKGRFGSKESKSNIPFGPGVGPVGYLQKRRFSCLRERRKYYFAQDCLEIFAVG